MLLMTFEKAKLWFIDLYARYVPKYPVMEKLAYKKVIEALEKCEAEEKANTFYRYISGLS